ncbi:MAG TPA: YbaB/EbfC family nucleoid-associated protein [Allosphingosinicella sp.]|nr:YbaB/EbfC family nucleoid-associated protein [Allosphingosinicella sp.]
MPDLNELMKMAQDAQAKLLQAQDDLDKVEVEGVSGGGMIRIRASAKGRIIGVEVDESLLQPSEKQMLEDLIAAAINDARAKADVAAQEAMRDVTGGLQLPPGFKMPF